MALFGAQILISLIISSIIQKFGSKYSFARCFLSLMHLKCFVPPTDQQLKESLIEYDSINNRKTNLSKNRQRFSTNNKQNNGHNSEFLIPKSLNVQLNTCSVSVNDLVHLKYFHEFQSIFDYSCYSLIIYYLTEIYSLKYSIRNEVNLSMIWCMMVLLYALKILINMTYEYFKKDESIAERSICLVMGFAFLFVSMCILIVNETILEFDLEKAYDTFKNNTMTFIHNYDIKSNGPVSRFMLKYCLSLWCGFMGSLFIFPGLRLAKMQSDLLKSSEDNVIKKFLLHLNFILPFCVIILWLRPIGRYYFTERLFFSSNITLMNNDRFEVFRIFLIMLSIILRIFLLPWYLRAYLNMANDRFEQLKKESGTTTNVHLQKSISSVFYYVFVVVLQYLLPVIMILFSTLMYKTLSDLEWCSFYKTIDDLNNASKDNFFYTFKKIFTKEVFRGLFGFITWWLCFLWFVTSATSFIFLNYFHKI